MTTDSSIGAATEFDLTKARELIRAIPRPEPKGRKWRVAQLADDLLEARKMGATYAQLCEALAKAGLEISESTLRQYLGETKRAGGGQRKAVARGKAGRAHAKPARVEEEMAGTVGVLEEHAGEGAAQIEPFLAPVVMQAEDPVALIRVEQDIDAGAPETASPPPAPQMVGAFRWKMGTDLSAEMEASEILRQAPGGLIDCWVTAIVTPKGRLIPFKLLSEAQMARIRLGIDSGPTEEVEGDLTKLLQEIDDSAAVLPLPSETTGNRA